MPAPGSLTDIPGIRVGHCTETRRPTGCTVVLFPPEGATAAVDVRGSAPGTRETDLLNPTNTVQKIHALLLAGGSAFGLEAATGVVKFLEEQHIGFDVGVARVPIVPAAILFDLLVGDATIRPTAESGYKACLAATTSVAEGSVGAAAGATVGKMCGFKQAMKGGLGTAGLQAADGLRVTALIAVNAFGDIHDPRTGTILAGARTVDGKDFADPVAQMREGKIVSPFGARPGTNTTIGVVATNAPLTKTELLKVAQMAHDGLARSIRPVHTPFDGDTLFAVSVPEKRDGKLLPVDVGRIGMLAAEVVADAVLHGVLAAKGLPGLPSASEFQAERTRKKD